MSESLLSRVSRLVSGTFTNMIDAAETMAPEIVARQAIEEIEKAIDEIKTEVGKQQATRHNANRELVSLNERSEQLKAQIQTALNKEREDLAEAGTKELIGLEDRMPIIENLIASSREEETELSKYLAGLRSKKEDMEKDLAIIKQTQQKETSIDGSTPVHEANNTSKITAQVEKSINALNRAKSSATNIPAGGSNPIDGNSAELEELHQQHRIAERLAKLKQGS